MDIQWKLGLAVSSDTCRSLNSPFVSLLLKIAEPSGQISQRSFEMTIPQFQVCKCCYGNVVLFSELVIFYYSLEIVFCSLQNFHKQVKEMAAVMETV